MKTIVQTATAPQAIGPYSQATASQGLVFVSGKIRLHPTTGALLDGGIEVQTRRVLLNLKAVLEAAGSSLDLVVKTTVFLKNMDDFPAMNAVYAEFFGSSLPARATVEVSRLPRNVAVEIDAIAALQA